MTNPTVHAFIQARMSSSRFPGKMLAPFRGVPMVKQVVERAAQAMGGIENVTVLTSEEPSDNPLAFYLDSQNIPYIRGPLQNVYERFRQAAQSKKPDWFVRITGDSPLLSDELLSFMVSQITDEADVISNTYRRSFPKGQSFMILKTSRFLEVQDNELSEEDQEHIGIFFFKHPDRFNIINISSDKPELAKLDMSVDTLENAKYLEEHGDGILDMASLTLSVDPAIKAA